MNLPGIMTHDTQQALLIVKMVSMDAKNSRFCFYVTEKLNTATMHRKLSTLPLTYVNKQIQLAKNLCYPNIKTRQPNKNRLQIVVSSNSFS